MTAFFRHSLPTIFAIVFSLLSSISLAQERKAAAPSATALAMDLRSGDTNRVAEALHYIPWDLGEEESERISEFRQNVSPVVAEALVIALDNQTDQFIALEEGHEDAHYMVELLSLMTPMVAALEDERSIPVLLKTTQFGNTSAHALAAFGPRIFDVIINYIESPERTLDEIDGSFLALTRTVERWRPLDFSTHATLRQLVIDYIQGYVPEHLIDHPLSYTFERSAMHLAASLGDADLKPMVEARASKFPGFVELYLQRWYEGPSGTVQEEPVYLDN